MRRVAYYLSIALRPKPFFVKDTTPIPRSNDGYYRTVDLRLQ